MQHGRVNRFLATGSRFSDFPGLTIDRLVQRGLAITQAGDQLVGMRLGSGAGALLDHLCTDRRSNAFQRQLRRFAVLLGTQHDDGFRVEFDGAAVGTFIQDFRAERSGDHGTVGRNAFATFTAKRRGGVHGQLQVGRWLGQVRGFECRIFQLLGRFDKTLLDLLGLELAGQLVLQAGERRHLRCFNAQQLDLVLVQRVQGGFEVRVVDARAGKAEVAAIVGRTWILGVLLGQGFERLALGQARLDFLDLGLGLRVGDLVVDFNQDVRRTTLFSEVGGFFLIGRLQLLVLDRNLVEEGRLLQLQIVDDHLVRGHELLGVLVVVSLDLVVGEFHRARVGLDVDGGEIAGLLLQTGESVHLGVGHETAAGDACANLADEHFLGQHLTELQSAVAQLTDHLVKAFGTELAVHLEFRCLQDDLVQCCFREAELGISRALQQQLAIDQALEGGVAQQFFVEQRSIEILAQLLHQLATLHVDSLAQFGLGDFFTVDLGHVLLVVTRSLENGFDTGERHQCDDDPDNGLGNPAL